MRITRYGSAVCAALLAMTVGSAAYAAPDTAKCEDAIAKGSRNVGNQEQKKNRKCVKDGSGDIDSCVDTESPKANIKRTKLVDLYASGAKCDGITGFNNTNPNDIADDTEDAAGDILRGIFGDPVDGIVAGDKCHDKMAKRAGKKFDTELKAFRACVKNSAPVANQGVLNGCVANGVADAKAQGTVQPKLEADMAGQCASFPPAGTEDGACSGCTDATSCATCIGDIVDCQACLAMNNSNNGTANCDLLDDGVVNSSCGGPPATATSTSTATPTATSTPVPTCPLAAGEYTLTQVAGGNLIVDGLPAFPFPAGGIIKQDVAAAAAPACVHNTVVPFPGGFSAPAFCIPALGFTTSLAQTGCGIGRIDSNGGSDFTVEEIGDTSAPSPPCSLAASCVSGANSNIRVDITVGDSVADVCGSGTANAIVSVPVFTTTWLKIAQCPDVDGTYNPGPDTLIVSFPQTLDFTTDSTAADFQDIDPDGCCIAGVGPASNTNPCTPGGPGGPSGTGTCINLAGVDLAGVDTTTVASGAIGSSGSPLYDLSFISTLPNEVTTTGPFAGAVCGSPPAINFAGTATRCVP